MHDTLETRPLASRIREEGDYVEKCPKHTLTITKMLADFNLANYSVLKLAIV